MRPNSRPTSVTLLLAAVAAAVPLHSQSSASITGVVTDPHGAALPNAAVVVHNHKNTTARKATSDAAGHFIIMDLPPDTYEVDTAAPGFSVSKAENVIVQANQSTDLPIVLSLSDISQQVTVEADASDSVAAQLAPLDARLDARSARTEISDHYIENFTSPIADYSEVIALSPGTFSVNSNGVGLGDSKNYFRGFADGQYDITFDGIPFEDTNSPTHHSWAFFPSQFIGGVDFDRSPGGASTIGPTPFGGSINLLSEPARSQQDMRFGVSYGSYNTILYDGNYTTGDFGPSRKMNLWVDVHHLSSDGFQTFNRQRRTAGALKYQYKISDGTTLTGFSSVLNLDTNTPNFSGPLRSEVASNGYNYLLNNNPGSSEYYRYNFYHVPTDFEYVGLKRELGHGWYLDTKPYTYSYNNHQNYANTQASTITAACDTEAAVKAGAANTATTAYACGTDKLNSYRKYGEITSLSQVSHVGIFRAGLWYEWAATNRFQIPQNPRNLADSVLPNFHEQFWTNSYQPFAEYEWHPTQKLTVVGGFKYARYTQDLKQYADNGKTIGNIDPVTKVPFAFRRAYGEYNSYLPSGDANYRIRQNWSVYGQIATGSVIPPSNVFDQAGTVSTLPKPTGAFTLQTGTVVKLKRVSLTGDYYHIHFGNTYTAIADPNIQSGTQFFSSGDTVTQGFEGETNLAFTNHLSLYLNGTVGTAKFVSQTISTPSAVAGQPAVAAVNAAYKQWVGNTPANTQGYGLSYQNNRFDAGIFNKRIGPYWNAQGKFQQVTPIDPFQITNLFFNYSLRGGHLLDGSKLRLSFNNLFNTRSITSVSALNKTATFTPNAADTLGQLPGRSVTVSFVFGLSPKR